MPLRAFDTPPAIALACARFEDRITTLLHLSWALGQDEAGRHSPEVARYLMDRAKRALRRRLAECDPQRGNYHDHRIASLYRETVERYARRAEDDDRDPRLEPAVAKPTMVIIRGAPGSGKTSLARLLSACLGYDAYEADMYHTLGGRFEFRGREAPLAHQWCRVSAANSLVEGRGVVISNPLLTQHDVEEYVQMADDVILVTLDNEYGSVHAPAEIEARMRDALYHHDDFRRPLADRVRIMDEDQLLTWIRDASGKPEADVARYNVNLVIFGMDRNDDGPLPSTHLDVARNVGIAECEVRSWARSEAARERIEIVQLEGRELLTLTAAGLQSWHRMRG